MHTSLVHFRQMRQQTWEYFLGNFTICLPICVQDLLDFWFARMKQEMVLKLGVGWANVSHFQMLPDTCHFWLGFLSEGSTPKLLNNTSMPGKLLRPSMNNRLTGTPIPDSVLVATLMNKTSGALQQHLLLNAATINTYDQMRNTLVQYFRSRHILTSSDSGLARMDIGALKGKGNFKGKNKGKEIFFCSCRARSRLRRSSKRVVFVSQFPHVGEEVRAKSQVSSKAKTNNTTKNQNPTRTKTSNPGRHPEN